MKLKSTILYISCLKLRTTSYPAASTTGLWHSASDGAGDSKVDGSRDLASPLVLATISRASNFLSTQHFFPQPSNSTIPTLTTEIILDTIIRE